MYPEAAEKERRLKIEAEAEEAERDPETELHAALDDPALEEEDLQDLLRRADKAGVEIDPGLRADVEFHARRLARFWGEDRD